MTVKIKATYQGKCDCGHSIFAKVETTADGIDEKAWIRCANCRSIGRYSKTDTRTA